MTLDFMISVAMFFSFSIGALLALVVALYVRGK